MSFLPRIALEAIDAYDWKVHRSVAHEFRNRLKNRTRFYRYLIPAGADMELHTVAVKTRPDGTGAVKEVVRGSVDGSCLCVKDMVFTPIAGYSVDWSPEKLGRAPAQWSYKGKWASEYYSLSAKLWKLDRPVINPEVLLLSDRFRWCAWQPDCGDLLDYLKIYVKHPRIELLSKAGAGRFATRAGFVRQIEGDKGLMRFFMEHLPKIEKMRYGVDVIRLAYRRGVDLGEAATRIATRRRFRGYRLPAGIDATRAAGYIDGLKIGEWQYCDYLRACVKLGMDLADTKVVYPRQFKKRERIAKDRIAEINRLADIELAKKQDADIEAAAARFAKLERARGSFRCVLPRCRDDFVREGKRLHNCLGDGHYAAKMARRETLIAFVRLSEKPRIPFVAVEYSLDQKKVLQCYGDKNAKPPKQVMTFVNRLLLKGKVAA